MSHYPEIGCWFILDKRVQNFEFTIHKYGTGRGPEFPRGQPAWGGGCDRVSLRTDNSRHLQLNYWVPITGRYRARFCICVALVEWCCHLK